MDKCLKFWIISLVVVFFSPQIIAGDFDTPDSVYDLVVQEILSGKTEGLGIFVTQKPLPAGTVIEAGNGPFFTIENTAWLVFVDDFPGANWSHGCRYVLVDAESGDITVKNGTWPPSFLKDMIRYQGPDPFGGENRRPVRTSQIPHTGSRSPEHLWAVILSGGHNQGNNHIRYWNDCSNIYMTLVNYYGYLDENIIVAISDGLDPAADQSSGGNSDPDLDGDGDDDIMYSCILTNVDTIFASLASTLGSQDTLFIFTTDHGSGTFGTPGLPVVMNLWNQEELEDSHFATLLEAINCREMIITMEPCFSGGFIDDVMGMSSTVPRVISTAANDMEYSWAMGPTYEYDTYVFHWTAAVNWADAYGVPVDADTNTDGEITMDEAYIYAEFMDDDDEHPQYAEWPAGYGSGLTLWGSGPTSEGVVNLDRSYYNCSDVISVVMEDLDLQGQGTAVITIDSTTEPGGEPIDVTETDVGHFEGSITCATGAPGSDGILQVAPGDHITLSYYDVDYGGAGPMTVTDEADVDCTGPVISNVQANPVSTDWATITWDTDEPASSKVEYGPDAGLGFTVEDTDLVTSHSMTLTGLTDCTLYFFQVESEDEAANVAVDDNGGSYYTFLTYELVVMLQENMDANPGWSTEGQWAWGQPTGGGGYYGNPDPTSGFTGDNVYGYNLDGDYVNSMPAYYLTTDAFDCSDATEVFLSFYEWLGVENNTWDHAAVGVSNNNGSSWTNIWENGSSSMQAGSWELKEYDISVIAAGYTQVRLRWQMGTTDGSVIYCGWNVDDVLVSYTQECTSVPTPTPTPDCINDGDVDFNGNLTAGDAQLAFLIGMGSYTPTYEEECAADCDGNGTVTAGDAQGIFYAAMGVGSCVDPI